MTFPDNFVWGAAAASYQIEGAAYADGKGLSVWDMYTRWPGKIYNGDTGDVACDHYHRYAEDVTLMQEIGLHAYRFSIAWPRILPEDTGTVNAAGLDFYDRLVDALLAADITPYATLFHWDFPYALFLRGGWLNRDSADWFAEYTRVVVERLGDRIHNWMTLNEPAMFINLGHEQGRHAPGLKLDLPELLTIQHNALRAHGRSVQVIRAHGQGENRIGIALAAGPALPADPDNPADVEAARRALFGVNGKQPWNKVMLSDPLFKGEYPAEAEAVFGDAMPDIQPGDMETIGQPLDFTGLNIYMGQPTRADADGQPVELPVPAGKPHTLFHWRVDPDALYWGPRFFHERYALPIIITENGLSNPDWVAVDGKVHDPQRIDFTTRYLRAFMRAGQDGADIRGYFHWSIMDNFEWGEGYKQRFGLIHIDYQTQQRTLKDSAYWYRDVIASNGANLAE